MASGSVPETLAQQAAIAAATRPRGVRLSERRLGKILLRGDPVDRAFMAAVGRARDVLLPNEPNTTAARGQLTVLWLGPDAWLLAGPPGDGGSRIDGLRQALADLHAGITDVTDGRVALRLAGPDAREVLAKGCPLDLHPRAFPPGSCAQSLIAKASVLIHLLDDEPGRGPTFDLYVARSFAHYLWTWLDDAGREYGVQIEQHQ
jgi:sarcosine oxidase subunit gamma